MITIDPYKPIPVGSQSGFILEPLYLESARRYPKHALIYDIHEEIFRVDLYRSCIGFAD